MRALTLGLFLFTFTTSSAFAFALDPYIDADAKAYDLKWKASLNKIREECKKAEYRALCKRDKEEALDLKLPYRYSERYYNNQYGKLTPKQADEVLKKLAAIAPKVRGVEVTRAKDGEITWGHIETEALWIQKNIMGRSSIGSLQPPLELSTGEVLPFYELSK